jgi:hypothetical protein
VDLIPNGGEIPVTAENREEYVRLYVQYTLDVSVAPQFEAFQVGRNSYFILPAVFSILRFLCTLYGRPIFLYRHDEIGSFAS